MRGHIPVFHTKNSNNDPIVNTFQHIVGSFKGANNPNGWNFATYPNGCIEFTWSEATGDKWNIGSSQKIKKYKWTHVMMRKVSGTIYLYVDGVQDNEVYTGAGEVLGRTDWPLTMGNGNIAFPQYFKGNQGQIRITKAARPVNVPQAIFTENAIDDPYWNDVIFLTKPSGGVLTDLKGHTITSHNGAALDASNPHFGLPTVLLNGTTQYYDAGIDPVLNSLGTSDLTIEAWIYCT